MRASAKAYAEQSLLDSVLRESAEMAAPVDVSDAEARLAARRTGSLSNAVRALEEGISATEGLPAVQTAAAARSRAATNAVMGGCVDGNAPTTPTAPAEVQYRSDSLKRVYEAQHHFVLAQLTAPGVEAFLADDFSDDDEAGGAISRSASKFV